MENKIKLLRISDLCANLACSRSTIARMEKAGQLPPAVKIGAKTKAWRACVIEEWLQKGGAK